MSTEGKARLKKSNSGKKDAPLKLLILVVAVLAVMIISSVFSYNYVLTSNMESSTETEIIINPEKSVSVEIPLGSTPSEIADILKKNGLIKHTYIFTLLSKMNGYNSLYKSGIHVLSKDLSYDEMMQVLSQNPVSVKVMIPEGYTYHQIADLLVQKDLVNKDKLNRTMKEGSFSYTFLKDLPEREPRLEGYLFPDTYEFDLKAGETAILKRMLNRFDVIFKPEYYKRAKELKMTPDQIITLASIIEREAKTDEERSLVAGVFYNRLKNKNKSLQKLQSCATIQYIYLHKDQTTPQEVKDRISKGIITNEDTSRDDPYNTYMYAGLPPGPICCPGEAAIKAALNPDETDYLYFVAKGDGTHQFSRTLQEHEKAVAAIKKQQNSK